MHLNKFIVGLKCNLTEDMKRYFAKRGVIITFEDDLLPDAFFCVSELSISEVMSLEYVSNVREPDIGKLI